jgi:hypothetical protein
MSWETFKETILRVANNPESIPDRNTVAKLYANAYDTAIKNGGIKNHNIPLKKGNVESMRVAFLAALEKGVTTHGPYDLVAQMGDGVKSYWANAIMEKAPIPIELPKGASANLGVLENNINEVGVWLEPLVTPSPPKPANTPPPPPKTQKPKPADDYNLRKMLDDAGYAAIKKYEDEDGCVSLISGRTGLQLTDWKKAGCVGYNPGMDTQEKTIRDRVKLVLGFDVWAKIPPLFRLQIYSFMYNADSTADTATVKGDKFRWIAGLLQAAKNETAQYRASLYNKTIRDVELPLLKTLTTSDFQKIYPTYLKVLDEMYKAISDAEFKSAANKTTNSEKAFATKLGAAYNLTWKDRPSKIVEYYNQRTEKKDKEPQEVGQAAEPPKQTTEEPTSNTPLKSGPIPPTNDTSLFVDYFIRTAINHLNTIQGQIFTLSNYGAFNGPGVINWTGYKVKGTPEIREIISVGDFLEDENLRLKQLKAEGLVAIEEIGNGEDADEFGGDGESATFYTGLVTPAQKRALKIAGEKVHYIGNYSAVRLGGKTIKGPGFDTGKCARWTYNLAYQYVNALRNKETPNGASFAANGNANADRDNPKFAGYWRSLEILGYKITVNTTYSKETLLKVLKSTDFDVGDVVVYWGVDATKGLSSYDYGHTQFFTGGINQNYKKSAIGTKGESPNAGTYKDTWTASNWDSDAYNNYGTYMVYKSPAKGPATKWRYLLFKAPTK